jgi:transmembrane protein 222
MTEKSKEINEIYDIENHKYPCSIVWAPIHGLTWFLPMIGHLGITDSSGNIYDFGGPYTILKNGYNFLKKLLKFNSRIFIW